jgi:hypothetical protein
MPEKLCRTSLSPAKIALGCGIIPRFHGCARLSMAGFQGVEFGSRLDTCDKTTRNVWPIIDYVIVGPPDDGFLAPPGHLGTKRRLTTERTSSSGLFRSFSQVRSIRPPLRCISNQTFERLVEGLAG